MPTQTDNGKDALVCEHFGSAPYFTIYDSGKAEYEIIPNNNEHHAHGMCQPLAALGDRNLDAVVCGGMGMGAIQKLNAGGIKAFRVEPGTVEETVKKYKNSTLEELTINNSCRHHGCH
jgi:predicted Fe-Mo cluster-binding NifX family protein